MKRLIDAIELKKAIEEKGSRYSIDEIIDMAPTEAFNLGEITEEDIKRFLIIWQRATSKGVILEPERPRGKWTTDEFGRTICGICQFPFAKFQSWDYCSCCGAALEMEGEPLHTEGEE